MRKSLLGRIAALAAYCYRRSSVVSLSVGLSVASSSQRAESIEMPFGGLTHVGPKTRVLDGVEISLGKR